MQKNLEIVKYNFYGDELEVIRDEDRDVWVSIRRVCDVLGVSHGTQLDKLKTKTWARVSLIGTPDLRGHKQQMAMIHLDSLPMWLATIDPNRVDESMRDRLEFYQSKCAQALRDYFFTGVAVNKDALNLDYKKFVIDFQLRALKFLSTMDHVDQRHIQRRVDLLLDETAGRESDNTKDRLIDLSTYLIDKGIPSAIVKKKASAFGKAVARAYRQTNCKEPKKCLRVVNHSEREVNSYTVEDLPVIDLAFDLMFNSN